MGYDHNHIKSTANLRSAFLLNVGFTILEIAGGLWTNSVAILSDALHDLGHSRFCSEFAYISANVFVIIQRD